MKKFEKFIYKILDSKPKKALVITLILASLFASVMMIPTKVVWVKMLPGKSANTFSVYLDLPTGSSIEETKKVNECVLDILKKEKEVTDIESYLGMGAPLDYAGLVKGSAFKNSENVAEVVVNLTDKHEREERSYNMVHRLRPIIQKKCEPLVKGTSIKMIEQPAGPPTLAAVVAEIYGQNNEERRAIAKRVASIFKKTPGLVDVDIMEDEIFRKYLLKPNIDKIQKSGLAVEQVQKILYLAFEGMGVGVKNSEDYPSQIELFLRLSDETRRFDDKTLESVKKKLASFQLMNQKGMLVPLLEVVDLVPATNEPKIMHKNLRRYTNVIAETDLVSQVYPLLDARETIMKEFSKEYKIEKTDYLFNLRLINKKTGAAYDLKWDGEMKVTLDTFRDLGLAFIAALILIYLLIVVYYKSYTLSNIVMAGSFLSIIGVIVGHWVADLVTTDTFFLTATSMIGFIALMGISSRNSILLIDFAKALMIEKHIPKRRSIAIATATRARPIMLTAIAIILGSALLASDPIFGGLGVALIGGTVAAVIVSLIFIPVLMDNAKAMDFTDEHTKSEEEFE
ncbi:efflux RND transporter permease subunit [Nitratiruptor sp. SB155-2]|uniref:efflux RND transporter permease subunit n=1 Tax=Nitratiruptor sp. (strain SB155-2) TaxID=387092 RepID=UPI00015871FC|nr:efflux RND transporter permease subunit [Nitratiruptor sp. SB155-2]BAF69782.1 acriflavin resistance protein, AcrB/AcrD/AcrF family [Nitratiruptor sp. SB155-2]